jgi:hypothetical protein
MGSSSTSAIAAVASSGDSAVRIAFRCAAMSVGGAALADAVGSLAGRFARRAPSAAPSVGSCPTSASIAGLNLSSAAVANRGQFHSDSCAPSMTSMSSWSSSSS